LSPGTQGTLTLSRVEVWVAARRWPREVGSETIDTIDTIDSVTVELAWEGLRTTFPGRFDRSTGALIVSGNPWLNCTMTNGRFEGDDFVAIPPATRTIRALCGSWSGSRPSGDDRGRLSILIDGAEIVGRAIDDVDGTVEPVEGSSDAVGEVVMTFPGYTLTGTAVQQSLVGSYQSTLDGGRSGNWGAAPCPF